MSSGRSREWRNGDGKDPQPVIEVTAELSYIDHLGEVPIRGGHEADVDGDRADAADPLELLLLQRAQNLGLELQRKISHFIQEKGSLMAELQASDLLCDGASEGPFFMPEQFTFEEPGGNGRTVELDEGVIPASAQFVESAGDELFAGSGFSENQDRGVRCRHVLHLFQYSLQARTLADDFLELVRGDELLFEIAFFFFASP